MAGIGSTTAKSARDLAIQAAKQMAREPLEVLKTVKEQTTGVESSQPGENQPQNQGEAQEQKKVEAQKESQDKMKSQRLMEALKKELTDIEHQDLFHSLQSKIAEGQEISLDDYGELTREQKEVLKAQMQAVKEQKSAREAQVEAPPIVTSKPSRRFGSTRKQEAEKQQQRVEKPVPPSG